MPTYEYECKKCGHNFEVFQSMSDEPIKTCTECGSEVRRLIFGGAGVIFKGSGFYVTDKAAHRAGGGKASGSGSGKKSGAAQSSPSAKDTKPAGDSAITPTAMPATKPNAQTKSQTA